MYMNDHLRSAFYEALGLNTTQFNRHVIMVTNNSIERVFPEVGAGPWGGRLVGRGCRVGGLVGLVAGWGLLGLPEASPIA